MGSICRVGFSRQRRLHAASAFKVEENRHDFKPPCILSNRYRSSCKLDRFRRCN
jgi:hypothetical protein